jgi:hypothetical protein
MIPVDHTNYDLPLEYEVEARVDRGVGFGNPGCAGRRRRRGVSIPPCIVCARRGDAGWLAK